MVAASGYDGDAAESRRPCAAPGIAARIRPGTAAACRRAPRSAAGRREKGEATMALAVVGRSIVRDEGPAKVTGVTRFTADWPLPGALWGKSLRSPLPHARIVRIDVSRAARLPGVRA